MDTLSTTTSRRHEVASRGVRPGQASTIFRTQRPRYALTMNQGASLGRSNRAKSSLIGRHALDVTMQPT